MIRTRIRNTTYRGEPAIQLENGVIRAVVLPNRGAKTASLALRSRRGGDYSLEGLAQPVAECYNRPVRYGTVFEGEDGTGIDDMCPTIAPCTLCTFPWVGTGLPDHGELWALPWQAELSKGTLRCSVHGIRIPYSLTKTVCLRHNSLGVAYRAENHCPFPLPFQWTAHAILAVAPGSRLIVPAGMDRIINSYPGNRFSEAGREYPFPRPHPESDFDLTRIPEPNTNGAQKYWFAAPVVEGRCGLSNPVSGVTTTIRFTRETLPYLGIWINEGGWKGYYNVGIEPSTSILDDPVTASAFGTNPVLHPRATVEWQIWIELEQSVPVSADQPHDTMGCTGQYPQDHNHGPDGAPGHVARVGNNRRGDPVRGAERLCAAPHGRLPGGPFVGRLAAGDR